MSGPVMNGAVKKDLRLAGRIALGFIEAKLTPLAIAAALLLGAMAIWLTPREEEPQIVVPMLDVMVQMPGASPQEVEQRVSIPMEKLLREVPGVEYLYSISHPGVSIVIVRFYVGTKEEDAIVKTYNKLFANFEKIPPGVSQPLIKVRSIDNVPILALTLWGAKYGPFQLRRVAGEVEHSIKQVEDVSETTLIGGQPPAVRVVLDTGKLAGYGFTPGQIVSQLRVANFRAQSGSFAHDNHEFQVRPVSSLPTRKTCSRLCSVFTTVIRCTCAMLRSALKTELRSLTIMFCSATERAPLMPPNRSTLALPEPSFRQSPSRWPSARGPMQR